MTLFDRIKQLSLSKGKTLQQVALDLGFGENIFYSWKKSSPKAEVLQKVADYFDVSVDYLLGRTNDPSVSTTSELSPGDDIASYFRINTANMDIDNIEELEEELKDYFDFLLQKSKDINKKKGK